MCVWCLVSLLAAALDYAARGFPVLPCHPVRKVPYNQHGLSAASVDPAVIREWWGRWPHAAIGLATGAVSGLFVVDEDDGGAETITALALPETFTVRTQSGGRHFYFHRPEGERWQNSAKKLGPGVDTRGDGGYVLAPPSPGYVVEVDAEMAELPESVRARLTAKPQVAIAVGATVLPIGDRYAEKALEGELRRVFEAPEGTRNDALNRAAFSLSQFVAAGALDEGRVRADLRAAALGAGLEERETEKTIASGFKAGRQQPRVLPERTVPSVRVEVKARATPVVQPASEAFPSELMRPPGLIGDIAAWVDECAVRPAPLLSFAAALAIVSAVCGRKYALPGGLRACLYVVGLATTGVGKDNGRKCAVSLLTAARMDRRIGAENFTSGAAVMKRLQGYPIQLCLLDEFGRMLDKFTGARAASHEREVVDTLMKAWSSCGSILGGTAYATQEAASIKQPHLVVYGTSGPDRFYGAMRSADGVDGWLNRLLVFEVDHKQRPARDDHADPMAPPTDLVQRVQRMASPGGGNLSDAEAYDREASPKVLGVSEQGKARRRELAEHVDGVIAKTESDKDASVWARASEQTSRLALMRAASRASDTVEPQDFDWAHGVVMWCTRRIARAVTERVADTAEQRAAQGILSAIRGGGGEVALSVIARALRDVPLRVRDDALRALCDQGAIVKAERKTAGRPMTVYLLPED